MSDNAAKELFVKVVSFLQMSSGKSFPDFFIHSFTKNICHEKHSVFNSAYTGYRLGGRVLCI